ncbi:hypothetical protein OG585_44515 [Streptomyces sp. NBC_01340]|nr:hypothetical protein OG585_44515 [Streptomyces sp. NBC_01340]
MTRAPRPVLSRRHSAVMIPANRVIAVEWSPDPNAFMAGGTSL